MIYTNERRKSVELTLPFGKIHSIRYGQRGCGCRLISLTCPENIILLEGLNCEYTIGRTKCGNPRINKRQDKTLYLILSSEGGARRGDGFIACREVQKDMFAVMAIGKGADGDAGRIGQWSTVLIRVIGDDDFFIRIRRSGYETDSDVLARHAGELYYFPAKNLDDFCESKGIDLPCELTHERSYDCLYGSSGWYKF